MDHNRKKILNDSAVDKNGKYVLYWVQQSQRAFSNPALEYAINAANQQDKSVIACFGLKPDYPEANQRHFRFMLEGLAETVRSCHDREIKVVVREGEPHKVALSLAEQASMVVCDRGYMKHQRQWRRSLSKTANKRVVQIEGDVIVPIETVSDKIEYAARTIRPKINRLRSDYLKPVTDSIPDKSSLPLNITSEIDLGRIESILDRLASDDDIHPLKRFTGGTSQARRRLTNFIRKHLKGYSQGRNDPGDAKCSELSPYLHFGQISPIEIAHKISAAKSGSPEDKEAFLEELIVRRELAINFVYFEPNYDRYRCIPDWAARTLAEHKDDSRPHRYTRKQMENAETHDPAWNAAMNEMRFTGYMHNYMRMYWGKKIIEWTNTPRYAYATAIYLNNKYFIDGRDANSYANVAWLFGLHDRPWKERAVFGKIRYMSAEGLRRKFKIDDYIQLVEKSVREALS